MYLKERHVAHKDIRPVNIYIHKNNYRIYDHGAFSKGENQYTNALLGEREDYLLAPEVF